MVTYTVNPGESLEQLLKVRESVLGVRGGEGGRARTAAALLTAPPPPPRPRASAKRKTRRSNETRRQNPQDTRKPTLLLRDQRAGYDYEKLSKANKPTLIANIMSQKKATPSYDDLPDEVRERRRTAGGGRRRSRLPL